MTSVLALDPSPAGELAVTAHVTLVGSETLPSQEGKKGRPRKHGRATLILADTDERTPAARKSRLRALAVALGVDEKTCAPYATETSLARETYVVQSIDKDTRVLLVSE